ncbi:MAG TPA: DUF1152 domain-containing protein [Kineosporiaceae bacterium]|nr:DUF1152 domain-containing protein [Kineosporiaceae bacterium]
MTPTAARPADPTRPVASSLDVPPLFSALAGARSVLLAGAGGGFDVYAALPLAIGLQNRGVTVHLANLSFTQLELLDRAAWAAPDVARIGPDTTGPEGYFPERTFARWLAAHQLPSTVYAFAKVGVQPLRAAYQYLVDELEIDAIVLIDGGTDILMRGDEAGLGTPVEDITSLAAVAGLDVPIALVSCLGFGIDAYHGVVHTQVLENLAALERDGGYLGALIAAATQGAFGDVQFTSRTARSTLFVNPLMAVYFTVGLAELAARCLYLDRIENTVLMRQVSTRIEAFRDEITPRIPRAFPH